MISLNAFFREKGHEDLRKKLDTDAVAYFGGNHKTSVIRMDFESFMNEDEMSELITPMTHRTYDAISHLLEK